VVAALVAGWAGAGSAAAQTLIGDRGASCATIPPGGGPHIITLTNPIPAGSSVLIAAGTTGNATYSTTTDTGGHTWVPTNSFAPSFRAFQVYGHITTALNAGHTITITYSAAVPGPQTSCASVSAFKGVANSPYPPVDTTGANGAVSNTPSVTLGAATQHPREVIHGAFVVNATTGGIGVSGPSNPLQLVCSGTFCVAPAYRIVTNTGAFSVSGTFGNAIPWAAVSTAYVSDVIFKDDF
jgi:hypothetical protein